MPRLSLQFRSVVRPTVALLTLLVCACGSDPALPDPVDAVERDAGKSAGKDAGKDAGKSRDAGAKDVEEDPSGEADGDEATDEAEATDDEDTGSTTEPSTDPDPTASKDAGQRDAGVRSDAAAPAVGAPDCAELTYENFGKKFVTTYCVECHSGSSTTSALGNVSLDSAANVIKNKTYLKKVTAPRPDGKEPRMPKGGNEALTNEERLKFGVWADCGAK